MYKRLYNSQLPKWLKLILYILITLTLIYLLCITLYKVLEISRVVIHWVSEKRNWWTFLVCILILLIGSFVIAQCVLGLDPLGAIGNYFIEQWHNLRNAIANFIKA